MIFAALGYSQMRTPFVQLDCDSLVHQLLRSSDWGIVWRQATLCDL